MASLREKVEAELEQMDLALRELPGARRVKQLSVLELGGTASLLSSLYHGAENMPLLPRGWSLTAVPRTVVIDDFAHSSRPRRGNLEEKAPGADWKVGVTCQ